MTDDTPPTGPGGVRWLILGLVVAAALAAVTVAWPTITDAFRASGLAQQPTAYSEVFFVDPALPEAITPGETLEVAFDIGNHEDEPITYRYVVTLECGAPPIAEAVTGEVSVAPGVQTRVSAPLTPQECSAGARLSVGVVYTGSGMAKRLRITHSFA